MPPAQWPRQPILPPNPQHRCPVQLSVNAGNQRDLQKQPGLDGIRDDLRKLLLERKRRAAPLDHAFDSTAASSPEGPAHAQRPLDSWGQGAAAPLPLPAAIDISADDASAAGPSDIVMMEHVDQRAAAAEVTATAPLKPDLGPGRVVCLEYCQCVCLTGSQDSTVTIHSPEWWACWGQHGNLAPLVQRMIPIGRLY
jgi:hypothetical protein